MNRNNNSKWAGRFGYLIFIAVLVANCSQSSTDQDQDSPPPTNEEYPATETRQVTNSPTELPPGAQSTTSRGITPAMKTPLMPAHPDLEQKIDPAMEPLIQMAKSDLAKRLRIPEATIKVLEARAVVWPDASLGCPQPGMMYIQIPFEGGLIRLEAGSQEYNYHSGGKEGLFLCEPSGG